MLRQYEFRTSYAVGLGQRQPVKRIRSDGEDQRLVVAAVHQQRSSALLSAQPCDFGSVHSVDNPRATLLHQNRREFSHRGGLGEKTDMGCVHARLTPIESWPQ